MQIIKGNTYQELEKNSIRYVTALSTAKGRKYGNKVASKRRVSIMCTVVCVLPCHVMIPPPLP